MCFWDSLTNARDVDQSQLDNETGKFVLGCSKRYHSNQSGDYWECEQEPGLQIHKPSQNRISRFPVREKR